MACSTPTPSRAPGSGPRTGAVNEVVDVPRVVDRRRCPASKERLFGAVQVVEGARLPCFGAAPRDGAKAKGLRIDGCARSSNGRPGSIGAANNKAPVKPL